MVELEDDLPMHCIHAQVIVTYLAPLAIGTAVVPATEGSWKLGYYGEVAKIVGGKWLAAFLVFSAVASQVGMFEAEMSSDSYQVLGMAQRGYLPRCFGARSRYGTPSVGILLSSMGVVSMLLFDFMQIVQLLNAAYCLAELLEFAAFVYLRIKRPDLPRAFKCATSTVRASVQTGHHAAAMHAVVFAGGAGSADDDNCCFHLTSITCFCRLQQAIAEDNQGCLHLVYTCWASCARSQQQCILLLESNRAQHHSGRFTSEPSCGRLARDGRFVILF
jgi:L-asparagine transporter-like permease